MKGLNASYQFIFIITLSIFMFPVAQAAIPSVTGKWVTNSGVGQLEMHLEQRGAGNTVSVSGKYGKWSSVLSGKIEGTLNTETGLFKGTFHQAGRQGELEWRFSSNHFSGQWRYKNRNKWETNWTGKRGTPLSSTNNTSTNSPSANTTTTSRLSPKIDALIQDEMAKQNLVGMTVGIVQNGSIIHLKAYGHADLARKKPITTGTVFRWASTSKPLTAVAALKLAEENTDFSLNDYVSDHVSYWSSNGHKGNIRIKHLLSNRSGIIHYSNSASCPNKEDASHKYNDLKDPNTHKDTKFNPSQAVSIFKSKQLCFPPDDQYKYSTFGFSLLGAAIEETSGKSYSEWVNEKIANKLGLNSLRQATASFTGFASACGRLQEKTIDNIAWKLPGGGWESDILDFTKFAKGLLEGKLLNDTSKLWTTITKTEHEADDYNSSDITYGYSSYGYGMNHALDKSRVWHGGTHDNTKTLLYLYPKANLGITLMINGGYADPVRISHHIGELFGQRHGDKSNPIVKSCTKTREKDDDCPGKFSAVWKETGNDVLIRRGYSKENFFAEQAFLKKAGYYTDDIELYIEEEKLLLDAIFRKGNQPTHIVSGASTDQFRQQWENLSQNRNMRLVDLETYMLNGKRRWAGIFLPGRGRYAMFRGQTSEQFGELHKQHAKDGYQLIDMEVYHSANGELRWAGVWGSGKANLLNRNYSPEAFGELRKKRLETGYTLIDIESYVQNGKQLWAGIWEKSTIKEAINRNYRYCSVKNNQINRAGIIEQHNNFRNQPTSYELIDWEVR
jgi:CubicO group peptidase (beta-lactamase class C family)